MSKPRFANALSTEADSERAVASALAELEAGMAGARPDLLAVFMTHHHGQALEEIGPRLHRATGAPVVLGCTGESVIGGAREIEGQPGLSLWGASLPDTSVRFFEVTAIAGPDDRPIFSDRPAIEDPARASLLLLADPYSFPMDAYLRELNEAFPGVPAMGGMASGGSGPGQNLLLTADVVREAGAIGAAFEGAIELRSVVSQGCRPIGKPWVVTGCDRNLIRTLGGRPAVDVLMETLNGLGNEDRELMQHAPFMGLAIDPTKSTFERGDLLVRGIIGLQPQERAIAVAELVRRGQTVQFLVRDADSAGEDLRQLMRSQGGGELAGGESPQHAGALLFSCNGRGTRMFAEPDHDISCVRSCLAADVPVAGFFAAGEVGPVGGRNFLHGLTASVAVFRPRSGSRAPQAPSDAAGRTSGPSEDAGGA